MTRAVRRAALLAFTLGGCAAPVRSGVLVLRVDPADARVLLDDRVIGSGAQLSGRPLKINAGHRRLEIAADGRYAARRDVDLPPGGRVELDVTLRTVPDGEPGD